MCYWQIVSNGGNDSATAGAGLAAGDSLDETGNSQDGGAPVTSLVLVRQNARHLFEPRTPETEMMTSSSVEPGAGGVVGSWLTELIVVQDECAGCLPLAAMLRPQRTENQPSSPAPQPETGAPPVVPVNEILFIARY